MSVFEVPCFLFVAKKVPRSVLPRGIDWLFVRVVRHQLHYLRYARSRRRRQQFHFR